MVFSVHLGKDTLVEKVKVCWDAAVRRPTKRNEASQKVRATSGNQRVQKIIDTRRFRRRVGGLIRRCLVSSKLFHGWLEKHFFFISPNVCF